MKKFIAIEINGNEAVVYEISDNNTYDLNLKGLLAGLTSNNYNYVEVEQFFNENPDNANNYIKNIRKFYNCNGINIYAVVADNVTDVKLAVAVATARESIFRSIMLEEVIKRKSKSRILTGLGLVAAVAVGAVIGYTVLSNTEIPVELQKGIKMFRIYVASFTKTETIISRINKLEDYDFSPISTVIDHKDLKEDVVVLLPDTFVLNPDKMYDSNGQPYKCAVVSSANKNTIVDYVSSFFVKYDSSEIPSVDTNTSGRAVMNDNDQYPELNTTQVEYKPYIVSSSVKYGIRVSIVDNQHDYKNIHIVNKLANEISYEDILQTLKTMTEYTPLLITDNGVQNVLVLSDSPEKAIELAELIFNSNKLYVYTADEISYMEPDNYVQLYKSVIHNYNLEDGLVSELPMDVQLDQDGGITEVPVVRNNRYVVDKYLYAKTKQEALDILNTSVVEHNDKEKETIKEEVEEMENKEKTLKETLKDKVKCCVSKTPRALKIGLVLVAVAVVVGGISYALTKSSDVDIDLTDIDLDNELLALGAELE